MWANAHFKDFIYYSNVRKKAARSIFRASSSSSCALKTDLHALFFSIYYLPCSLTPHRSRRRRSQQQRPDVISMNSIEKELISACRCCVARQK